MITIFVCGCAMQITFRTPTQAANCVALHHAKLVFTGNLALEMQTELAVHAATVQWIQPIYQQATLTITTTALGNVEMDITGATRVAIYATLQYVPLVNTERSV